DAVAVRQPEEGARVREGIAEEDIDAERDRVAVARRRLDEAGADDAEPVVPPRTRAAAELPRVAAGEPEAAGTATGVVPAERAEPTELGVVERPLPAEVLDEH